jgi:hypothetical protein
MNAVDSGGLDVSSKTQKEESYPGPADTLGGIYVTCQGIVWTDFKTFCGSFDSLSSCRLVTSWKYQLVSRGCDTFLESCFILG